MTDFIGFISRYQYNLNLISEEDKSFVLQNKSKRLHFSNVTDKQSVIRYPGFVYTDDNYISDYYKSVYWSYVNSYTPPRGFVGKESVMIIGIAPGYAPDKSFSESCWLYGPSSQVLHEILNIDYHWYFTNICKEPFVDNKYDIDAVKKYYPLVLNEFNFFKGHKKIFLGHYPVYDQLIRDLNLDSKEYIFIRHPSFFKRRGKSMLYQEKDKINNFIGRTNG